MDGLNSTQLEAVTSTEGFVRVIAGAGSGKTCALSHRFAYLVNEIGVLPEHILCVTFTNKAAAEMKARIRKIAGINSTGYIATFHSFCVSILQEDSSVVGYPKSFIVLDNNDIDAMLQMIYDERKLTLRDKTFSDARDMIEIRKTRDIPFYYEDMIALSLETLKQKYEDATEIDDILFYGYLYQEKKNFALDYNDLIVFVLHIFDINALVRQKWQERLEYIMVDEFQDIDDIQYRLMKALCEYHNNLFVVGDPDQTIYTWRGANIRYLLDFDKNFTPTKAIVMNENYRSTKEILDVANSLISKNKNRMKKELTLPLSNLESDHHNSDADKTDKKEAEENVAEKLPVYNHSKKQEEEAQWIAKCILQLHDNGEKYADIAVLYRAHYVSREIEKALAQENIPFTLYAGTQFFDREEIKDALSYVRLCVYKDDLSFRRIVNKPRRNIGKSRIERIEERARQNGSASLYDTLCKMVDEDADILRGTGAKQFVEMIERISRLTNELPASEILSTLIHESGYEILLRTEGSQTRLDNLAELKQSVQEFEISCGEECTAEYFLKRVALFSGLDAGGAIDAVKLMTVHTAKGLEFPHVFLCAMNEGIFPSQKTKDPFSMEEERRLCFVAITRAEKRLFLSDSEGRNLNGSMRYPSRFVFDIDRSLLEYTAPLSEHFVTSAMDVISDFDKIVEAREKTAALKAGDSVTHAILGRGVILEVSEKDGAFLIRFDNLPTPRKLRANAVIGCESTFPDEKHRGM